MNPGAPRATNTGIEYAGKCYVLNSNLAICKLLQPDLMVEYTFLSISIQGGCAIGGAAAGPHE